MDFAYIFVHSVIPKWPFWPVSILKYYYQNISNEYNFLLFGFIDVEHAFFVR